MRSNRLIRGVCAAGLLAVGGAPHPVAAEQCLSGLKPALVAGGFSGSVDCRNDRLVVREVGHVRTQWRTYTVYSYRYSLKPVCPECAVHGGQRIIFMDGNRYLGQYKPDFANAVIRHGNLVLEASGQAPVTVRFTPQGPQAEILLDGELLSLFK